MFPAAFNAVLAPKALEPRNLDHAAASPASRLDDKDCARPGSAQGSPLKYRCDSV